MKKMHLKGIAVCTFQKLIEKKGNTIHITHHVERMTVHVTQVGD